MGLRLCLQGSNCCVGKGKITWLLMLHVSKATIATGISPSGFPCTSTACPSGSWENTIFPLLQTQSELNPCWLHPAGNQTQTFKAAVHKKTQNLNNYMDIVHTPQPQKYFITGLMVSSLRKIISILLKVTNPKFIKFVKHSLANWHQAWHQLCLAW